MFEKFEELQVDNDKVASSLRRRYRESSKLNAFGSTKSQHHFFAKYLTSRNLFGLEVLSST